MANLKPYVYYKCKDCDVDFMLGRAKIKKINCPVCADRLYVEEICTVWMDRPFRHRKYWTAEEDSILLDGKKLGYTERRIAESLPGRSYEAVRNRWGSLLAKKKREEIQ